MRRLILFDIDGTLVTGGPAKDAFHVALTHAFGTTGDIDVHDFAGKTDPQIARELLTGAGIEASEVDEGLPGLFRRYLEELEARLVETPMEVLEGVAELLDALEASGRVALGLVTGNVRGGARLKLGSADLFHRFDVGGFGSDSEERNDLPGIAIGRARDRFGRAFPGREVVIVGDTPRDVACGLYGGCRTLAVATGRYDEAALADAGADRVVPDLGDTDRMMELLLEGGPADD